MSYCRFSSDLWQCDVYVYEDCDGGWTTHVASARLRHEPPQALRDMQVNSGEEFRARWHAQEEWLEEIRASGLNVPQYAIDALREEHEDDFADD